MSDGELEVMRSKGCNEDYEMYVGYALCLEILLSHFLNTFALRLMSSVISVQSVTHKLCESKIASRDLYEVQATTKWY